MLLFGSFGLVGAVHIGSEQVQVELLFLLQGERDVLLEVLLGQEGGNLVVQVYFDLDVPELHLLAESQQADLGVLFREAWILVLLLDQFAQVLEQVGVDLLVKSDVGLEGLDGDFRGEVHSVVEHESGDQGVVEDGVPSDTVGLHVPVELDDSVDSLALDAALDQAGVDDEARSQAVVFHLVQQVECSVELLCVVVQSDEDAVGDIGWLDAVLLHHVVQVEHLLVILGLEEPIEDGVVKDFVELADTVVP